MSKIGWEREAKGKAMAGFEMEAAMAPPTNACAVAVIFDLQISIAEGVNDWKFKAIRVTLCVVMFPVLFSIGNFSVSSFGVFFGLSFILGIFLVWRLARAWDLEEEKLLDLVLLTVFGGLVGSRLYFILEHFSSFGLDILKWVVFYKNPGFSFWGGFLGGWLTLGYFSNRFKQDFYLLADIASVGFLASLSLSNIGCLLGGCNLGVVSNSFLAMPMVGVLGERFPVQILEAFLIFVLVINLWSSVKHFHKSGTVVAKSLIYLGLIQLLLLPLKDVKFDWVFPLVLLILGVVIFYRVTKRNILRDFKIFLKDTKEFMLSSEYRKRIFSNIQKNWYNKKVSLSWKIKNSSRLLRRINVKLSHKNSKFN